MAGGVRLAGSACRMFRGWLRSGGQLRPLPTASLWQPCRLVRVVAATMSLGLGLLSAGQGSVVPPAPVITRSAWLG
jgi:hypothetical protein